MTRMISVAAIQTSYGEDLGENIAKTEAFVREAAGRGAQVILPSELFQGRISARRRKRNGSLALIRRQSIRA